MKPWVVITSNSVEIFFEKQKLTKIESEYLILTLRQSLFIIIQK